MRDDMEDAPSLGLYLALIWLALYTLPEALWTVGMGEWVTTVADAWRSIGARHG